MAFLINPCLAVSLCILLFHTSVALNKYSADANEPKYEDPLKFPTSLRELDKPFRMAKLNIVWIKAKNRLTDTKLQSIFSDLKLHDKEEIAYKHFKAEEKDPNGEEEARLRKKLIGIMSTYGLLEHFNETENPELLKTHKALNDGSNYIAKDVFQDKRLNKLWVKAEMGGFTHEELQTLKEEFQHHQDKIDEYMSLLKDVEAGDSDIHENSLHLKPKIWNVIEKEEEITNDVPGQKLDYLGKAALLREKHLGIRDGFDRLGRLTAKGPNDKQFIEPKVQGLWRFVLEAPFSPEERASLKEELHHYEGRLLKLRHLHTEAALEAVRQGQPHTLDNITMQQHIKKHARTVQKLHRDLETRIMQKHTEL
ncbi:PREDICTED: alpha-2-macroglobulin receptor-associated protein [Dufourea novaeangliae]|uniref:Alpha-2-macroglobulin receptor-associated protein n=1 Tax=Dufourea novaeangliae TaxID=178035 RepID=A0A154PC28_DUFNO|nr:PREDICTED: alpha-2-macroglobulin receptor-associated protein [Dufourea novaeangliae]KZC08984.1 Alpha-2-macroglobulin receptor-associated protein [Dufourea novaeangliae]